jgi:hypothetical protein
MKKIHPEIWYVYRFLLKRKWVVFSQSNSLLGDYIIIRMMDPLYIMGPINAYLGW